MIGGVIVDVLVLAAILAFAWGATQLGGLSSLGRLFEAIVAFAVAALVRDPAGDIIEAILGTSIDLSRLIGMVLAGLAAWIAANSLFRWWRARRESIRFGFDEDDPLAFDDVPDDPLDSPAVARIAGGLLGLGWSLLFVALLVLQPADTPVSRSTIESRVGGMLIHGQDTLEWLREGFPHYTQTLPKGKVGAVVGERSVLPMREPVESEVQRGDADELLRSINELRRNSRAPVLTFNPDVAGVARRHAESLVDEKTLSYGSPGGGSLDQRVLNSLGESAGSFGEEVGTEVVWAHDPETAMRGLLDSSRAQSLLKEARWSEIGIGVATTRESGWFNGRIYVLLLVGAPEEDDEATDEPDDVTNTEDASGSEFDSDAGSSFDTGSSEAATESGLDDGAGDVQDTSTAECFTPGETDLDGDGIPDEQSVDPALVDCGELG